MTSTNRPVHFYGDSHMQGFEIDHDEILGRNTFKEKKDLIGDALLPMLENNDLGEHTFNVPQYKKSFGCSQSSSSEGLTYKFLENCFKEYFDENNTEGSEEKSKELLEYIKTHRKKTTKTVLKCSDLE